MVNQNSWSYRSGTTITHAFHRFLFIITTSPLGFLAVSTFFAIKQGLTGTET